MRERARFALDASRATRSRRDGGSAARVAVAGSSAGKSAGLFADLRAAPFFARVERAARVAAITLDVFVMSVADARTEEARGGEATRAECTRVPEGGCARGEREVVSACRARRASARSRVSPRRGAGEGWDSARNQTRGGIRVC